jgi:hypothetical protein
VLKRAVEQPLLQRSLTLDYGRSRKPFIGVLGIGGSQPVLRVLQRMHELVCKQRDGIIVLNAMSRHAVGRLALAGVRDLVDQRRFVDEADRHELSVSATQAEHRAQHRPLANVVTDVAGRWGWARLVLSHPVAAASRKQCDGRDKRLTPKTRGTEL